MNRLSPAAPGDSDESFNRLPNFIATSVRHIDYDELFAMGIRHVVFDVDNTLAGQGRPRLSSSMQEFLNELKSHPKVDSIHLASNSPRSLRRITRPLAIGATQPQLLSFKPMSSFYRRVLMQLDAPPEHVVMVGDRLIQDVWGANRLGFTTILVKPLGRDLWLDRLIGLRAHERRLLRKYAAGQPESWFA